MEIKHYYEILKAISDESRFKIINILLKHDLCVGGLAKNLQISKPAVSQHLQVLRKIGLVSGEKRGYYTHYAVNRSLLKFVGEKTIEIASKTYDGRCQREKTNDCECKCNKE
ncbi:metalloregulator ArsR/SmtB family transcription factor [Herbivorax sp. ANBcel31]|uniref:ArsR/SmtB family transcription factor n=1 Tax=Herbivorax sp. ANBcel31 TaxID=3069754 RepID=UPI0027ADBD19|nr:metalloregulator ArsR/SmtB family transcription factor [Herbivorax sp. ANBcel31]MDQ2087633.1 metalloregulator ArsR/SmtB family transcription factor [Herbivorax sp. ANBcel31]